MDIGTETVTVPIVSYAGITEVEVRVDRSKDKVLCKVDRIPELSIEDYEGAFGSGSWTDQNLEETAQQHAERHVYGYLGIA